MLALALAWQCCYLASLPWYPRTQPCSSGSALAGSVACDSSSDLEARLDSLVAQINNLTTVSQRARLLQNAAGAVEDAMIAPYPWWNEALHGFAGEGALAAASISGASCYREHEFGPRTCATSFPAHITTAGAFNRTLVRAIGTAIGVEARAFSNLGKSGLTFWTPNLNIFRDPRWGRGQETPGEDPVLNADWAEDFVGGFQDPGFDGPGKMKASACCKHFAAYSLEQYNASIDRHSFNAVVSEQDLVDTYYPAFVSCANRGNASGLMCSYNSVNGVPSCANKNLLTNLAREKWGFNGYITSDCGAVSNVARAHHFSPVNDTCRVVLDAGMDSDCGTFGDLNFFEEHLVAAMQDGTVGSGMWERAARNLFRVQMRLGMFDPDSELPYRQWGVEKIDTSEHRLLALEAARQGIVLAVNHNRTLPIGRDLRVAVVGPNADAKATLLSNYHGTPPFSPTSVLDGLTMLSPDYNASLLYAKGCTISSLSSSGIAEAVSTVEEADVSIVVIGLDDSQEREGKDRTSIKLPGVQETLVLAAANASSSPIVVVVISGGPVDLSLVVQHPNVGAIVIAGYPGQSGGLAVAEVVFGAINPSGRLSQTWYGELAACICDCETWLEFPFDCETWPMVLPSAGTTTHLSTSAPCLTTTCVPMPPQGVLVRCACLHACACFARCGPFRCLTVCNGDSQVVHIDFTQEPPCLNLERGFHTRRSKSLQSNKHP
eukprot:INCI16063.1.p1 GENE.INCI16063.1~~INCI16063.1.p1  ORF type:complete len:718 (-),score=90.54 INCI16063.1:456-2609(-)